MKNKQVYTDDIFELIRKDGVVYLYYDYENAVLKATLDANSRIRCDVKLKDSSGNTREPFNRSMEESVLVTEALLSPVLITKEEYDHF